MKKFDKKFIYGTGSVALIAGACIIIVLLNIMSGIITDKFGLKLDVTETRYLNFSDEFETFIKSVDKKVTVYYMVNPNEVTRITDSKQNNDIVGSIDENNYRIRIKNMFEKICVLNPNIKFEIIDPELNPELVKNFSNVQIDDIGFLCNDNYNKFNVQEILYYDETGRRVMDAESKFASMISSVIREKKINVAFTTGHGEGDLSAIKKVYDDEGIEYKDINIITDGLSDDFDLVFVYAPVADFTTDEIKILEEYLASGNNMQIYLENTEACATLTEYMKTLGVNYTSGYVQETNSSNYTILNNNYYIIPNWNQHSIANSLTNNIFIPNTISVEPLWESKNSIDVYPLLYTSSKTVLTSNPTVARSYCLTTISSRITESSIISNVIAGGSSKMYSSEVIEYNKAFLKSITLWMGRTDDSVAFEANIISNEPLEVSSVDMWKILLIGVLPLLIVIIGIIVWIKRRYL